MTELNQPSSLTDQQNALRAFVSSAWANPGMESLLRLQADFLVGMESVVTDWLHRRHEAVLDARRLLTRLRDSQDINDQLRAQQEWMAGAFRRWAADATSYQSAFAVANRIGREAQEKSQAAVTGGASTALDATPKPQTAKSEAR